MSLFRAWRCLDGRHFVERHLRHDFDRYGPIAELLYLKPLNLVEMVRPDDPGSVRFTFNAAHDPAHRFEPADMGFGKALASVRIVPQIDRKSTRLNSSH